MSISIISITKQIGETTETLVHLTADARGDELNATLGNAPEMITAIITLLTGLYDMVRASFLRRKL